MKKKFYTRDNFTEISLLVFWFMHFYKKYVSLALVDFALKTDPVLTRKIDPPTAVAMSK